MLNNLFCKVDKIKFVNNVQGYIVATDKCKAVITITENEVILSFISSSVSGGGSDMLDKLERYSANYNKVLIVSNIINLKLQKMVESRGYIKDYVPFAPDYGIMDLVEVYKRTINREG